MATSVTAIPQAGSYELDAATLYDVNGGATDIKNVIVEFNIYESMFQPFVTGNLIINDATNLLNSLPIVGQEELELKFRTRGAEKPESMVDFSLHRLRVVGVKDRLQTNKLAKFTTNLGDSTYLEENNQFKILFKESNNEPQPYVNVRTNLFAKIDRKSFYRLIDFCTETTYRDKNWLGFHSNNIFFPLIKSEQLD